MNKMQLQLLQTLLQETECSFVEYKKILQKKYKMKLIFQGLPQGTAFKSLNDFVDNDNRQKSLVLVLRNNFFIQNFNNCICKIFAKNVLHQNYKSLFLVCGEKNNTDSKITEIPVVKLFEPSKTIFTAQRIKKDIDDKLSIIYSDQFKEIKQRYKENQSQTDLVQWILINKLKCAIILGILIALLTIFAIFYRIQDKKKSKKTRSSK